MNSQDFINLLTRMPPQVPEVRRFQKGGRMVGPGSGVSDSIPTVVKSKEGDFAPAMLSEGEYVIRADAVSQLGGGATDPGVKVLDKVVQLILKMDREEAALFGQVMLQAADQILSVPGKSKD